MQDCFRGGKCNLVFDTVSEVKVELEDTKQRLLRQGDNH